MRKRIREAWLTVLIQRVPHEISVNRAAAMLCRKSGMSLGDAEYYIRGAVYSDGLEQVLENLKMRGYI